MLFLRFRRMQDLDAFSEESYQTFIGFLDDTSGHTWERINHSYEGVEAFMQSDDDQISGVKCVKESITLDTTPEKAYYYFQNEPVQEQLDNHPLTERDEIFERISEHRYFVYQAFKSPIFIVKPRDFCLLRNAKEDPEKHVYQVWEKSIDHPKFPEDTSYFPSYVRGNVIISGNHFEPLDGDITKCKFTYMMRIDPRGLILPQMMNLTSDEILKRAFELRQFINRKIEEEKEKLN